jgi:hypothetical protein
MTRFVAAFLAAEPATSARPRAALAVDLRRTDWMVGFVLDVATLDQ